MIGWFLLAVIAAIIVILFASYGLQTLINEGREEADAEFRRRAAEVSDERIRALVRSEARKYEFSSNYADWDERLITRREFMESSELSCSRVENIVGAVLREKYGLEPLPQKDKEDK